MKFFKTIEEVERYVPISQELDPAFVKLPSSITTAENKFVLKEIGKDLAAYLQAAYDDFDAQNGQTKEAFQILQRCVAHFAIALFIPKHKVQVDSQGVRVSENNNRQDAKPYDTSEAIKQYEEDGWSALEDLLEYLEDNAAAFTDWAESPQSSIFADSFIRTTFDLQSIAGKRFSRRLFKEIKPHITRHEDNSLKPITGDALFDELLTQFKANTLSETNKKIIGFAKSIVGFGALKDALEILPVKVNIDGLTVAGNTSNSNVVKPRAAAGTVDIKSMISKYEEIYHEQVGFLTSFLHENADDYELFKTSSSYSGEYTGKRYTNEEDSKIFLG